MRQINGWIWFGVGVLLFAASFAFTYYRLLPDRSLVTHSEERLAAGARMILRHILDDGRRGAEASEPVPAELIGATLLDIHRRHPTWIIVRFTADEIVAEGRCAPSPKGGYLGERDGRVAIFEGHPGACSVLRELTDIPVESIRPDERERLKAGMPFADEDERQQLIDGLMGD